MLPISASWMCIYMCKMSHGRGLAKEIEISVLARHQRSVLLTVVGTAIPHWTLACTLL